MEEKQGQANRVIILFVIVVTMAVVTVETITIKGMMTKKDHMLCDPEAEAQEAIEIGEIDNAEEIDQEIAPKEADIRL